MVAYWSRLLGAIKCWCHWSKDQLLLGKAANFWISQAIPLSSTHSLCLISWCFPPCWHIICLLWLWITQFNLTPKSVLLSEEYSQPLTEHFYTPCCSRNSPPAERMPSVKGEKKRKNCYYQPLRPTQRKLLRASEFVAICWEDRVKANKKSENIFFFFP